MDIKTVDLSNFSFNFQCEDCDSNNVLVGLDRTPSEKNPVLVLKCLNEDCSNTFNSICSVSEKNRENKLQ